VAGEVFVISEVKAVCSLNKAQFLALGNLLGTKKGMRLSKATVHEQALGIAQSVIDGQMRTVEAAHSLMSSLRSYPDLASQDDFKLICAIVSETDDLPIGRVRALWHPDSLSAKDCEIARCDNLWRDRMLQAYSGSEEPFY
jgi:hypothetical protein